MGKHVLVVGKAEAATGAGIDQLRAAGLTIIFDAGLRQAPHSAQQSTADLILVLATESGVTASAIGRWLEELSGEVPLIVVLPQDAAADLIALAIQIADDFIIAPARDGELCHRVIRLLGGECSGTTDDPPGRSLHSDKNEIDQVKQRLVRELAMVGLVGDDPAFRKILGRIPLAARSHGPILVVGETGTGKELCARAIHSLSARASHPFIPADCTTLPDHLFENEMFGHVSGAFTDARRDQKGLVALAQGGTLFLDEINSLSMIAQAKLLRFLQERTYRPLGSSSFARVDATIVAATNCDLQQLVRQNQFRADLFFRLNVVRLEMIPLRRRRADIPLLARHFVARCCAELALPHKALAMATLRKLMELDWPGNVRELDNTIRRAVLFSEGPLILPCHIADSPDDAEAGPAKAEVITFREARSKAIASFERHYVEELMRDCGGNVSRAARFAAKDRRAFGRLVKRYEISREGD